MDDHQVWHKDGEKYRHVANVQAADVQTALLKTQHGLLAARWQDAPGVEATPGDHRSTSFGDIIIAPDGQEYKFAKVTLEGFAGKYAGFEPAAEIREQHYAEWLAELEDTDERLLELEIAALSERAERLERGELPIRPLTQELIDSVRVDEWPGYAAALDFGIESPSHLGALQFAIIQETVTPQELDAAMGNGAKLTEIAQRGDNPYRNVTFKTAWDELPVEPESEPELTPEENRRIVQGMRDEAANVELMGKGLDYSDAPYANAGGEDYATRRKAAIERARHAREPKDKTPEL